jgi:hypothetical protein
MVEKIMKSGYITHQYFNSYYYANIVNNLIIDRWNYLGFISEFFTLNPIAELIKPWQKDSLLHRFIYLVVSATIRDESYDDAVEQLKKARSRGDKELGEIYIELVFKNYRKEYFSFQAFCGKDLKAIEEDDFYEYYNELLLCSDIEGLFNTISEEVFYILFNNRQLLMLFNVIVSQYIQELDSNSFDDDFQDYLKYLSKEGQLKREKIPEWIKKAVFFRDRGKCCNCKSDLSGTLTIHGEKEFDHIVSLSQGGANDVTNIQLLCKKCNRHKGDREIVTSSLYEKWY